MPSLSAGVPLQSSIPATKDVGAFRDFNRVRVVIEELMLHMSGEEEGRKSALRWMPTEQQLEDYGLQDVLLAIELLHGGHARVAGELGLRLQGPGVRASLRTSIRQNR